MSGRVLDFKQYIGGADNVITLELFPSQSKRFTYTFPTNVSGYTFTADFHTLLLDTVTYDRSTGDVNFADTNVIGHFDNYAAVNSSFIDTTSAGLGVINFTIPPDVRHTGPIFPSARTNVPATIVSFQWDTGTVKELHRFVVLERWEAGVDPGDPSVWVNYVPMGTGAITGFTVASGDNDVNRVPGYYVNVSTGLSSNEGVGATFDVFVDTDFSTKVTLRNRGSNYNSGDTITIPDSSLGSGGGNSLVISISTSS